MSLSHPNENIKKELYELYKAVFKSSVSENHKEKKRISKQSSQKVVVNGSELFSNGILCQKRSSRIVFIWYLRL